VILYHPWSAKGQNNMADMHCYLMLVFYLSRNAQTLAHLPHVQEPEFLYLGPKMVIMFPKSECTHKIQNTCPLCTVFRIHCKMDVQVLNIVFGPLET